MKKAKIEAKMKIKHQEGDESEGELMKSLEMLLFYKEMKDVQFDYFENLALK